MERQNNQSLISVSNYDSNTTLTKSQSVFFKASSIVWLLLRAENKLLLKTRDKITWELFLATPKLFLTARAHLPVDVLVLKVPQSPGDRQGSVDALDHDGAAGVLYIVQ